MKKLVLAVLILALILGATLIAARMYGHHKRNQIYDGPGKSDREYRVDYNDCKDLYENAKDTYKAGEEVELYWPIIATDTDYSFYLDGEELIYSYEDGKGIVIRFTMPTHDVSLEFEARNSMLPQ